MNNEQIKKIVRNNSIKLEELSDKTGLPLAHLRKIVDGEVAPSSSTLACLLTALDLKNEDTTIEEIGLYANGIGDRIRALREDKGFNQEDLSHTLEISVTYLSEIERGTKVPSLQTLQLISNYFMIPISLLIGTKSKISATAKKIKKARELKDYSQKNLAQKSGLSTGMIAQLESGKVQPSLKTVEKLSQALGVSVCYLILEEEDVKGIVGGVNSELRDLLYDPKVQMIIGSICTLKDEELKLILNFIDMVKNPRV